MSPTRAATASLLWAGVGARTRRGSPIKRSSHSTQSCIMMPLHIPDKSASWKMPCDNDRRRGKKKGEEGSLPVRRRTHNTQSCIKPMPMHQTNQNKPWLAPRAYLGDGIIPRGLGHGCSEVIQGCLVSRGRVCEGGSCMGTAGTGRQG